MTRQYLIFGLRLECRFKLGRYPEVPIHAAPDVVFRKRKIVRPPDGLTQTVYKPFSVASPELFFLEVPNIARFLIKGHDQVYVEKLAGARWPEVYTFFFDTVLTALLIKNDIFVFHASAVAFGRRALMFCSGAGLGKSTLAAFMAVHKGARIIEDDKCLVQYNAKSAAFQLKNQFPFIELWNPQKHLAEKIGLGQGYPVRKNIAKFRYPIEDHVPKRAVRLERIILVNMNQSEDKIEYDQITGIEKVRVVKNYSHLDHLVAPFGKQKSHFRAIADIVQGIEVHRIKKSRGTKLSRFIKFIEDEVLA